MFFVFDICTNLIIKYIESTGQSKAPGTVSNVSQSRRGSKQSSTENAMDPEKDGRTSKSGSLENSTDKRPGTVSRINSLSFFTSIRFFFRLPDRDAAPELILDDPQVLPGQRRGHRAQGV